MSVISLLLDGGRDSKIRGKPDENGLEYWSVYNFISSACVKSNDYARHWFYKQLNDDALKEELEGLTKYMLFNGDKNKTPVMTIRGLGRLLTLLGSKVAAEYRAILETTFTRVLAGDKSLVKVIEANAEAAGGVQQMCRDALELDADAGGVADDLLEDMTLGKRKMTDEELALQLRKERIALEREETALIGEKMGNVKEFCGVMNMLDPNWKQDKRLVVQVQDWLKNSTLCSGGGSLAITNGEVNPNKSISISQVAMELGMRMKLKELSAAGSIAAEKYRERYHKEPDKHEQYVDNVMRMVNSYTERDRDLVEDAVRLVYGRRNRSRVDYSQLKN